MKAPETVKNYINGVRVSHLLFNQPLGAFNFFEYQVTIRRIAHLKQHQPKQAAVVTLKLFQNMYV